MKSISRLIALSALIYVVQTTAALESAKFDPDNVLPQFPVSMQAAGITRGSVIVATSVGADGKISDSLVLAYTNPSLVRPTLAALKEWKAAPAKLDGEPVPVQMVLSFNYTLEGAVISANITNHFLFDGFERVGDGALMYRVHSANELDQTPTVVNPVTPKYSADAEKQGVRGSVKVEFYIDEQGEVRMPAITEPVNPYLAAQAVEALRAWKFSPPTHHGKPVLVAATQEFKFGEAK